MSIDLISHEGILNTATNKDSDQIQYGADFDFQGNLQPINGASKQTELGIEGEAMYTLYLNRLSDSDVARFALSSKVRLRPIGGIDYRNFFVTSRPIIHDSDPDLAHIEIVLKEDAFG
ncbi:MAG: hypothetical protein JST12_14710 [Armatimonadetes bacterium]|nr:hypothetical protein [Armatimonadota bacterium]